MNCRRTLQCGGHEHDAAPDEASQPKHDGVREGSSKSVWHVDSLENVLSLRWRAAYNERLNGSHQPKRRKSSFCKRLFLEGTFIRRRPIDRGHGNVVESEIDTELRAVMDIVIHYETAEHGNFW